MIIAESDLISSMPVRRTMLLERLRALLSGAHLHHEHVELIRQLRIDVLHLLAHAHHRLIERETGAEHDAEQIDRIGQRLLQLVPVALHQPVQHLLRQQHAEDNRRDQSRQHLRSRACRAAAQIAAAISRPMKTILNNDVCRHRLPVADARLVQLFFTSPIQSSPPGIRLTTYSTQFRNPPWPVRRGVRAQTTTPSRSIAVPAAGRRADSPPR